MSPSSAFWLYTVFALGAVALYFLLPQRQSRVVIGGVLVLIALAAWGLMAGLRGFGAGGSLYFCIFGALAIGSAIRVITHIRPVYSALYLILLVVAVAALLVLLQAEFVAAALIIIYGGAILVTYLFVIMLAQQSGAPAYDRTAREPFWTVAAGFLFMAAVAGRAGDLPSRSTARTVPVAASAASPGEQVGAGGNTATVGASLMTTYIVGVELSGLLLLISMIGAIGLSRKRVTSTTPVEAREFGRAGREAVPF